LATDATSEILQKNNNNVNKMHICVAESTKSADLLVHARNQVAQPLQRRVLWQRIPDDCTGDI